jgi:carboxynorspermidine decarboxylase
VFIYSAFFIYDIMSIDLNKIPETCYIIEEELLRRNLALIKSVAERADVEIILAFKGLPCGAHFLLLENM